MKMLEELGGKNGEIGQGNGGGTFHAAVMEREVIDLLRPAPGKVFLDGTLGGGTHTLRLLEAGACVVGIDRDPDAVAHAARRLWALGYGEGRLWIEHARFSEADRLAARCVVGGWDGALLDLGVSSHQLQIGERGFSWAHDGPLDMRMDPGGGLTAADLVNGLPRDELGRILCEYGEEPMGRRVAAAIARRRVERPFDSTRDLAAVVESVVGRRGARHPATRVFMAIRIAVNCELAELSIGLERIAAGLRPGARFAVLTFHSLEDRIVKRFFKERSEPWVDSPAWPEPRPNPRRVFDVVTRKVLGPSPAEREANPRSRSAKLRVVERRMQS